MWNSVRFSASAFIVVVYLSEHLGWILTWLPWSTLSSKSSPTIVTRSSLSGWIFWTPTTNIGGARRWFVMSVSLPLPFPRPLGQQICWCLMGVVGSTSNH